MGKSTLRRLNKIKTGGRGDAQNREKRRSKTAVPDPSLEPRGIVQRGIEAGPAMMRGKC